MRVRRDCSHCTPVGMGGRVGDRAEVELRQDAVPHGAVLEVRRGQALRDQLVCGAERVEHVERRRMEGRGPQLDAQINAGLEHRHRHAMAYQVGRRGEPDRARAGDQDAFV